MEKRAFRFAARKIADWMIEGGKEFASQKVGIVIHHNPNHYGPRTIEAFKTSFGF